MLIEWSASAQSPGDTADHEWVIYLKDNHTKEIATKKLPYNTTQWKIIVDQATLYGVTVYARNQHGFSSPLIDSYTTRTSHRLEKESTPKLKKLWDEAKSGWDNDYASPLAKADYYNRQFEKAVQEAVQAVWVSSRLTGLDSISIYDCCFKWHAGYTETFTRSSSVEAAANEVYLNNIYIYYDRALNHAITDVISDMQKLTANMLDLIELGRLQQGNIRVHDEWRVGIINDRKALERHLSLGFAPQKNYYYLTRDSLDRLHLCLRDKMVDIASQSGWERLFRNVANLFATVFKDDTVCKEATENLADQLLLLSHQVGKELGNRLIDTIESKTKDKITTATKNAAYKAMGKTASRVLSRVVAGVAAFESGVELGCVFSGFVGLLNTGRWSSYSTYYDNACNTSTAKWLRPLNTLTTYFDWTFLPRLHD